MNIRTVIVDDEALARQKVRLLLRDEADIEIIGECEDGSEAATKIKETEPDLVFLDIQMSTIDGFEMLRAIPQRQRPVVIFTTAYDQHALRAFDAHALDYLLKPFKPQRFKQAVQRAREFIINKQAGSATKGLLELLGERPISGGQLTRLAVKTPGKVVFVNLHEIHTIEAAGKYAVVHTAKEKHILREAISSLESHLPPQLFLRISRSIIVNAEQILELQPMFKGENVVVLKNGNRYATTRSLRELQQRLEFK